MMTDGRRCQSPALRLYDYCRHHRRYHAVAPLPDYARAALASPRQVHQAILRGVGEVMSGALTPQSFTSMVKLFERRR